MHGPLNVKFVNILVECLSLLSYSVKWQVLKLLQRLDF